MNLAKITDINRIVNQIKNGYDIRPDKYYDRVLLDSLKLGEENYVHTKYSESFTLPKGTQKIQKRRWGGLTAHTTPLKEGMPPAPDKTSMEYITFTATQFARYMEFTDRVDLDQIDPQLHHYTVELGDVMARTFERYARETYLSAASKLYANNKTSEGELVLGDVVTIADLRFLVLRMQRLLVKPIEGNMFIYITSPESMFDLINDPLVVNYMKINNTTRELYENGEPFPLFRIKFVQTMLDEFYTPDLDNVGEYYDGTKYQLRAYAITAKGDVVHANIPEDRTFEGATKCRAVDSNLSYLHDGTAISGLVNWNVKLAVGDKLNVIKADGTAGEDITLAAGNIADYEGLAWHQLPIHRSILFGKDGLARIAIEGEGSVKTYIQGLGSAGVLDPVHQRQSIGVKVNSIGFGIVRDEAICITLGVPTAALATSGLTAEVMNMAKTTGKDAIVDDEADQLTPYTVKELKEQKHETVKAPKINYEKV